MSTQRIIMNTFFAATCALFLSKVSFAEPPNLSKLKEEARQYHDSGQYQEDVSKIAQQIKLFIEQRAQKSSSEKLALIFDIDETTLSNYNHFVKRDFSNNPKLIHKAIMAADAPALKPMLSVYQEALKHGINVFFVTGRKEPLRTVTINNLVKAGYHKWTDIYLKPENYSEKSIIPFKTHIREIITQKGYKIIASVGDQYSDLKGGFTEKTFKLPNPYYFIQ